MLEGIYTFEGPTGLVPINYRFCLSASLLCIQVKIQFAVLQVVTRTEVGATPL